MKIKKAEIYDVVRTFAGVAKLSGGDDLIHFSKDRISVRSHVVDVDVTVPGIPFEATVSAVNLKKVLADMSSEDIDIRETDKQLKIADGVRKATLKKKDVVDDRILQMDFDKMKAVPENFWNILSTSSFDGTGNKGIQFLGKDVVNKTNTELLIFDTVSEAFYLSSEQAVVLLELGMSLETRMFINENNVEFNDLKMLVSCRRSRVPAGLTPAVLLMFKEKLLANGKHLFSEIFPDSVAVALKHVANFGADDVELGESVQISFDSESGQVTLSGENNSGSFEEVVDMEYTGKISISIAASVRVIHSLIGQSFTLMERPDQEGYFWLVSEDPALGLLYIGGGKKI